MTESNKFDQLPQATLAAPKRLRISGIWIIPLLAIAVALGIAINALRNEGPTITIVFKDAEGIEAGKTFVKYKDVNIGQVTAVRLTDDFSKVEVTAKITKDAAGLIVEDAKFWVMRPRVSLSGISGLGTLLGGNYIGFESGKSDSAEDHFKGLDVPPIASGTPGRQFLLEADDLGSLGTGSPIYFRKLQVGQIIAYDLAADGRTIEIKAQIDAPYDRYVTAHARFWNASGFDVAIGANGVDVRTESLVSLLAGGIAFDAPTDSDEDERAAANTVFRLFHDRATAMKQSDTVVRHYQLTFNESLRGLSVGAPVTFFGLQVGVVTAVDLTYDDEKLGIRPRVAFDFYPERIITRLAAGQDKARQALLASSPATRHANLQRLVQTRGLRAQLRNGSLLTGQLYIALDYFPDAPAAKVNWNAEAPELPVIPSALPDLESKLSSLMAKLDRLPIEAIGNDLSADLKALRQTLDQAGALLKRADTDALPALEKTLASADRLIANADKALVGPDAPLQQDLRDALQELTAAARSLRTLADYLERHPESLIHGKAQSSTGGQ